MADCCGPGLCCGLVHLLTTGDTMGWDDDTTPWAALAERYPVTRQEAVIALREKRIAKLERALREARNSIVGPAPSSALVIIDKALGDSK